MNAQANSLLTVKGRRLFCRFFLSCLIRQPSVCFALGKSHGRNDAADIAAGFRPFFDEDDKPKIKKQHKTAGLQVLRLENG
ncbi:MAG: hypothetical protein SOZ51_01465 [Eubacteriales bacterium]|nr:hypothetical protein [Eubacteriales bacterium]